MFNWGFFTVLRLPGATGVEELLADCFSSEDHSGLVANSQMPWEESNFSLWGLWQTFCSAARQHARAVVVQIQPGTVRFC